MAAYNLAITLCVLFSCCLIARAFEGFQPCPNSTNADPSSNNTVRYVMSSCLGQSDTCVVDDTSLLIVATLENKDLHHISKANWAFMFSGKENMTMNQDINAGNSTDSEVISMQMLQVNETYNLMMEVNITSDITTETKGMVMCSFNGYREEDESGDVDDYCLMSPLIVRQRG